MQAYSGEGLQFAVNVWSLPWRGGSLDSMYNTLQQLQGHVSPWAPTGVWLLLSVAICLSGSLPAAFPDALYTHNTAAVLLGLFTFQHNVPGSGKDSGDKEPKRFGDTWIKAQM